MIFEKHRPLETPNTFLKHYYQERRAPQNTLQSSLMGIENKLFLDKFFIYGAKTNIGFSCIQLKPIFAFAP